jgi:hypothetical protein
VAALLREQCCHQSGIGGLLNPDLDAILPAAGYWMLAIDFDNTLWRWMPMNPRTFQCRIWSFCLNLDCGRYLFRPNADDNIKVTGQ